MITKPFIDRRIFSQIDLALICILALIMGAGLLGLYSATHSQVDLPYQGIFRKQILWLPIALCVFLSVNAIHYNRFSRWAYWIYGITIIFLIAVLVMGKQVQGARRWLCFGPFIFQPSELAKLSVVLAISKLTSNVETHKSTHLSLGVSLIGLGMTLLPAVLVLVQPDLGSAIIIVLIGISLLVLNKMPLRILLVGIFLASVCSPFVYNHLHEYQKARVRAFLNPGMDPTGTGYHINQSKIAIGSGQLLGKGFKQSTQTRLHYLPEHYTDFIFSVVAEEWGFLGACVLIVLYLLLILRSTEIALYSKDTFGYSLCIGASVYLFWHVLINLGMVTGLLPVVGVPLLFVSYGGSSLVAAIASFGLVQNVHMRRFLYKGT